MWITSAAQTKIRTSSHSYLQADPQHFPAPVRTMTTIFLTPCRRPQGKLIPIPPGHIGILPHAFRIEPRKLISEVMLRLWNRFDNGMDYSAFSMYKSSQA